MIVFWRLLLAHFLGDFTLQLDFVHAWKRRNRAGLLAHGATHLALYAALTRPYLGETWVSVLGFPLRGWACISIIFALHLAEDLWRMRVIERNGRADNTAYFLWDQLAHLLVLFLFIPLRLSDMRRGWFPEKWPVVAIAAVLATHFGTVLLYFMEKDLKGAPYPKGDEKYVAMAMRLVLFLCFLLPWPTAAAAAVVWAGAVLHLKRRKIVDHSWLSIDGGMALGAACGLAARMVWHG